MKLSVRIGIFASTATAVVLMMTGSLVIAGAFGALAAGIAYVTVRTKSSMNEAALVAAWPEVIDLKYLITSMMGKAFSQLFNGLCEIPATKQVCFEVNK